MKTLILIDQPLDNKKLLEIIKTKKKYQILPLNINSKLFLEKNSFENILSTNFFFGNNDHKLALKLGEKLRHQIRSNVSNSEFELKKYNAFVKWLSNIIVIKYFNKNIFKLIIIRNILKKKQFSDFIFIGLNDFFINNDKLFRNYFLNKDQVSIKHFYIVRKNYFRINFFKNINKATLMIYDLLFNIKLNNKIIISSINYNFINIKTNLKKVYLVDKNINFTTILKIFFKYRIQTKIIFPFKKKSYNTDNIFNIKNFIKNKIISNSKIYKLCLESQIPNISEEFLYLNQCFNKFKSSYKNNYNFYYISPFSLGFYDVVGEFVSLNKHKSMCIPHGTVKSKFLNNYEKYYNSEIADSIINNKFSHLAIQSKLSMDASIKFNKYSKKINISPLCFSVVNKNIYNNNILLATTFKDENNMKFFGVETFDEYISSTKDIIKIFQNKNLNLIIQPHPTLKNSMLTDDIKKLLQIKSRNVMISKDPFIKNLKNTLLLLSYSSTVIEEALLSDIPVAIYDRWNRYNHLSNYTNSEYENIRYFNNISDLEYFLNRFKTDNQIKKINSKFMLDHENKFIEDYLI